LPIPAIFPVSEGKGSEYPEIGRIHQASCLLNKDEVKRWNASNLKSLPTNDATDKSDYSLAFETSPMKEQTLERTILLRGSSRKFSEGAISFTQLSNILYYTTLAIPMDYMDRDASDKNRINSNIDIYLIANSVAGIQAYFHPGTQGLLKLKRHIHGNIGISMLRIIPFRQFKCFTFSYGRPKQDPRNSRQ
jgi:hypothetical protein